MDENSRNHLWKEYMSTKNSEIRDKIILEYAPLVKIVAGRLSIYLGYNVEYDDLVGYGIFGLIDAIDKFDYEFEKAKRKNYQERADYYWDLIRNFNKLLESEE